MEADAFLMCVSRLIMNDYFKTTRPLNIIKLEKKKNAYPREVNFHMQ